MPILCLAILIATGLCHGAELLILSRQLEQFLPSISQKIDAYRSQVAQITNFEEWQEEAETTASKDAFAAFLGHQSWLSMPFEGNAKFEGYTEKELEAIYDKIITDMHVVVIASLWSEHEPNLAKSINNIVDQETGNLVGPREFQNAWRQFLDHVKEIVSYMRRDLYKIFGDQLSIMTKADDLRALAWQAALIQAISTAIGLSTQWAQSSSEQAISKKDYKSLGIIFRSYNFALHDIENMVKEMHQPFIPYDELKLYSSLLLGNTQQFIKKLFKAKVDAFSLWCNGIASVATYDVPLQDKPLIQESSLAAARELDKEAAQLAQYLHEAPPKDNVYQNMLQEALRSGETN